MRITYTNSAGKKFDLIADKFVKIKTANFHNWTYTVQATSLQYGEQVRMFKKAALQYNVEIYVTGTKWEREAFIRALHEAASYDILKNRRGVLQWGEWKLDCNILSSSTYPHESRPNTTVNTFTVYAPKPFWYTLEEIDLINSQEDEEEENGLNFPFNFPFNFSSGRKNVTEVESHHYIESDFILTINGPADSPLVTINDHPYQVYVTVPAGSTLTIDSQEGTIIMRSESGSERNCFSARRKDYSIFEKIPAGELTITKNGTFDAVLALKYERDEPTLWT